MTGQLQESGAATALIHLPRGISRVPIDGLEVIRDVPIGEVLKLATQPADRSLDRHRLVHVSAGPLRGAAVIETKLVVRIPISAADPAPKMPCDTRHPVGRV